MWRISLALVIGAFAFQASQADAGSIFVAAGETFKPALEDLAARYAAEGGSPIEFTFGASATLAKKIEDGSNFDIVICAQPWGDYLAEKSLFMPSREKKFRDARLVLGDRLFLVGRTLQAAPPVLDRKSTPASLLGSGRLAMADPDKTETGRYSRGALANLGLWDGVAGNVMLFDTVRGALDAVADGTAGLGVASGSDLQGRTDVHVAASFPDEKHPVMTYTFAITKGANPEAEKFLAFIENAAARELYTKAGFVIIPDE